MCSHNPFVRGPRKQEPFIHLQVLDNNILHTLCIANPKEPLLLAPIPGTAVMLPCNPMNQLPCAHLVSIAGPPGAQGPTGVWCAASSCGLLGSYLLERTQQTACFAASRW